MGLKRFLLFFKQQAKGVPKRRPNVSVDIEDHHLHLPAQTSKLYISLLKNAENRAALLMEPGGIKQFLGVLNSLILAQLLLIPRKFFLPDFSYAICYQSWRFWLQFC